MLSEKEITINICSHKYIGRLIMKRTPVSSSNIESIGYENMILEVEFKNGSVYQYFHIPDIIYNHLMAAESHGKYFNEHIKNSKYPYTKIK
jgi:hypothetical protein